MILVFDTSALVRFFTNDIASKAQEVKQHLDSDASIEIPDVVFPELEYVLLSQTYDANRQKILSAFHFLCTHRNIKLSPIIVKAIDYYQSTNLDMADCIILASSTGKRLISFDTKLNQLHSQLN